MSCSQDRQRNLKKKKMTTIADEMSGHKTKKHDIKYICVVYIIKVFQWRL